MLVIAAITLHFSTTTAELVLPASHSRLSCQVCPAYVPASLNEFWGGDVPQLAEPGVGFGALLTQVRIPGVARDFYPSDSFLYRLSYGVHIAPVCNSVYHPRAP